MSPPLPPLTLGILTPLVCLNLLSEQAAVNRDRKAFASALHLDPLIGDFARLPQLADELWAVNEPLMAPVR
jgi:alpha-galactosidase/6-phospho-beta-glucosidase family protein